MVEEWIMAWLGVVGSLSVIGLVKCSLIELAEKFSDMPEKKENEI